MNINESFTSAMGLLARVAAVVIFISLSACSDSPTGETPPVDYSIGGTVSGLDGTVVLLDNGADDLSVSANGAFAFATRIASGAAYSVTVGTEPDGQTCEVANGSGTATTDVTDVTVECDGFVLRPLPEVYATGKAINYGEFRAGGPGTGEIPSDEDILEDLGLMQAAGFNLLRLFRSEAVTEKILRLAAENFPELQFQLGVALFGMSDDLCEVPENDEQIENAIRLASTYKDNVATISVGNETSFFSCFMPINCLELYIERTRQNVTQPVTADDDYTFYAGENAVGGSRCGNEPDTILPLLDFVSIHMYPVSYFQEWDWKQEGVEAGPLRAAAMMNAAFARAQQNYQAVYDFQYVNASGETVTVGASLPIVVGETGWKWRQTNNGLEIEEYAANPVNAKWYSDLLRSWEGSAGGPPTIFVFVAFDEAWKGIDDGWGFWDENRMPNYALCGDTSVPDAPPCNEDLYEGAGYYDPPPP